MISKGRIKKKIREVYFCRHSNSIVIDFEDGSYVIARIFWNEPNDWTEVKVKNARKEK